MYRVENREIDKWTRPWEIEKFDDLKVRDERFFSIIIKGCLGWLTQNIIMYNKPIRHYIFNTGSSRMYVESNGYELSWNETTGEDWMYMATPRCICQLGNITIPQEELTNPFVRGNYERYSQDGQIKGFNAEIRRLPIEIELTLNYECGTFNESIILIQEMFDKLVFQKYYSVSYLGQQIHCSIEFPNSDQITIPHIDLGSAEDTHRQIQVSIKIATYYPIVNVDTEISSSKVIASFGFNNIIEQQNVVSDKDSKNIS